MGSPEDKMKQCREQPEEGDHVLCAPCGHTHTVFVRFGGRCEVILERSITTH